MRYCLLLIGFIAALSACAQDNSAPSFVEKYIEGTHYQRLSAPVPTVAAKDKVEITEVFRFGCQACFRFEDAYEKWSASKPAYIEFIKNPVVWDKTTAVRAQVYYAGKALGVEHEALTAVFNAIHTNAKTRGEAQTALTKEKDIIAMFVSLGIDEAKATKMYSSFGVKSQVNQADRRARSFSIAGTPEIFVDGRYRVSTSTAGSFDSMLEIATFLANKVAVEKGLK